jgi:hypothetical protein
MGGLDKSSKRINPKFSHPLGPSNALKAAATTRVGKTKGIALNARSKFLPLNSNLANNQAAGRATIRVIAVDKNACHIVNQNIPRKESFLSVSIRGSRKPLSPCSKLTCKMLPSGKK